VNTRSTPLSPLFNLGDVVDAFLPGADDWTLNVTVVEVPEDPGILPYAILAEGTSTPERVYENALKRPHRA
jgi:hypothetical protein